MVNYEILNYLFLNGPSSNSELAARLSYRLKDDLLLLTHMGAVTRDGGGCFDISKKGIKLLWEHEIK